MILGEVKPSRDAIIRVRVRGPLGVSVVIDAIVDTGFTDALTLPPTLVQQLELPFRGKMDFGLADGSQVELDLFIGEVEWNGRWREVVIAEAKGAPLVGMELMLGCHLGVDVIDGGRVEIRPIGGQFS